MKIVLNVRCKKVTKGITFIHLEEILQLFVNMNVLKLANLKLFAKSINLKFWKDFVGIKFCGHQKKNCNFTGTIFHSWPQTRKLPAEIYI